MGLQVPSLLLRFLISLILLSQNLLLSSLNFFSSLIYFPIYFFTSFNSAVFSSTFTALLASDLYNLKSESSQLSKLWFISDFCPSFSKRFSLLWCTRSTSELRVAGPLSLLATNLLDFMSEFMAGPIKSDYLSDRSEMGCRLQESFLLLSQFSMMPSNLQLNLSKVYIQFSCWAFSSFCFSISSRQSSMDFCIQAFSFLRASMDQVKIIG